MAAFSFGSDRISVSAQLRPFRADKGNGAVPMLIIPTNTGLPFGNTVRQLMSTSRFLDATRPRINMIA